MNQPIQTIKTLKKHHKLDQNNFDVFRLFESWPTRIIDGKLYRSMILFGYDPYINDHDKKRWKKYEHKIKYGFQIIDFNYDDIPDNWVKDENQPDDYLETGKIYGWIPVYHNKDKHESEDLKLITDQYYIEGFNWYCEKKLHILKELKNTNKYKNCLDGYYNLLGRKIPGTSGSRENISQNYILLEYNDTIIKNVDLNYNNIIKWMEKNPKVFGFLITNKYKKEIYKLTRYNTSIKLNNKYDIYYARKQYPLDGLI